MNVLLNAAMMVCLQHMAADSAPGVRGWNPGYERCAQIEAEDKAAREQARKEDWARQFKSDQAVIDKALEIKP
jgi:hypothetical protein